ncbi:MAG: hypothetical protein ACK4N5_10765, partial [Myxococcales bacterium]
MSRIRKLRAALRSNRDRRGNVLIVTAVTTAVLAGLAAAAINSSGQERQSAVSKMTSDQLQSCLAAGRQMLLSKLRVYGMNPTSISITNPEGIMPDGETRIYTGHMSVAPDGKFCNPTVTGDCDAKAKGHVKILRSTVAGAARNQVRDVANIGTASATLGGQYYLVTMVCEITGRQAE